MNDQIKQVMIAGAVGTVGIMWVVGGIALVMGAFQEHWALGWLSLFVWIWGCITAGLYFKVQRFF